MLNEAVVVYDGSFNLFKICRVSQGREWSEHAPCLTNEKLPQRVFCAAKNMHCKEGTVERFDLPSVAPAGKENP